MTRRRSRRGALRKGAAALLVFACATAQAQQQPDLGIAPVVVRDTPYVFDTAEQHGIRVSVVVRGVSHPFSVAFLPNGDALLAERSGDLRLVRNAASGNGGAARLEPTPIAGTPQRNAQRTSGLHDVVLHPQFARNALVYFTYNKLGDAVPDAKPPRRQSAVTLARGRLEGTSLRDVRDIFTGDWSAGSSGSRIAFGGDGLIYMTTGAPFSDAAQQLDTVYGKVLRLRDDGTVPTDNPFFGRAGARPEIFSFGHRDQLGLAVHPNGTVLAAEHGPNGGDEVNEILAGHNYGWPKWSFGRDYDGSRISPTPLSDGIDQPLVLWIPSIAPTGLAIYSGDKFPTWRGNLFVGSARIGEIPRTGGLERVVLNDKLEELRRERLLSELHQRIRDVRQGPDGLIYVLTDEDDGAMLRIEPAAL